MEENFKSDLVAIDDRTPSVITPVTAPEQPVHAPTPADTTPSTPVDGGLK